MTEIDYRECYIQNTAETLCRHALDAERAIWPAIESIARARSCWGSPAVIEGWAILPDLFFGADLPDVDACWLLADEPTPDAAGSHGSRLLPRRVRRSGTDHEVRRAFGTLRRGARARRKDKQRPHDSGQRRLTTRHSAHASTQRDHAAQIDRLLHGAGAATFSL